MGNVVESVEKEFEKPVINKNRIEDHEVITVIDLDRDNWQEKVQEYKKNWYAHHSKNGITKKEQLCLKQEPSRKKQTTTLKIKEDGNERFVQGETRKAIKNQENEFEFQPNEQGFLQSVQEEEILQQRQELTERSLRSRQRIECFRKKYKLCERDYCTRDNNVDLTDRIKEKEEREKTKKLRHHIRVKYQLPVEVGSQRLVVS